MKTFLLIIFLFLISCKEEETKPQPQQIPSAGAKTIGDQSWKKNRKEYMEKCRLKVIIQDEELGGYSCVYQGQNKDAEDVFVSVGHHSMCVKSIYCGRK